MNKMFERVFRPGVALLLALCMVVGMCPVVSFAAEGEEEPIVYVSIGDSMTNGYGLEGYDGSSGIANYGSNTYANRFAAWLAGYTGTIADDQVIFTGTNGTVDHRQLAMSGMRAEDLHWVLELDYTDDAMMQTLYNKWGADWTNEVKDLWYGDWGFVNGDFRTWSDFCDWDFRYADGAAKILDVYSGKGDYFTSSYADEEAIANAKDGLSSDEYFPAEKADADSIGGYKYLQIATEFYQESVKDADIISLALGNTNFGTYMLTAIMDVVMYGKTDSFTNTYDIEKVYDLANLDPSVEAQVRGLIDKCDVIIDQYFSGLAGGDEAKMEALRNIIDYCVVSYMVNYIGSIDAILTMNPDVDIIQVALMNAYANDNAEDSITLGDIVEILYTPINAFIAALPTYMQATGKYQDATFYYAETDSVDCMVSVFGDDFYKNIEGAYVEYPGPLNGDEEYTANLNSTVRKRFVENIVGGETFGLIANVTDVDRTITVAEIATYDMMNPVQKAAYAAENPAKAKSIALYLALEKATIEAGEGTVTMDSLAALSADLRTIFAGIMGSLPSDATANGIEKFLDAVAAVVSEGTGGRLTPDEIAKLYNANGANAAIYEIVAGRPEAQAYGLTEESLATIHANVVAGRAAYETAGTAEQDAAEMTVYYTVIANKIGQTVDAVKYLYENNTNADVVAMINGLKTAVSSINEIKGGYASIAENVNNLCYLLAIPETLSTAMVENTDFAGILCMNARCLLGTGIGGHPSTAGHNALFEAVKSSYENDYTSKDETIKNIEIALDALYNLVQEYGPEVAAQVWAQWEEYGYVDAVETSIRELEEMLKARYEYYTEEALPAIAGAVDTLVEQKNALCTELDALKEELAAKKAELEEVISQQEIGSVHVPDITIDVTLDDNAQTEVPEHECVVEGDSIEAELEAAIKDLEHAIATIEALIADIEADIADMVALAEQIAAAVAELEKTVTDIAAAAEDLSNAVEAVFAVLQDNEAVLDQVLASFEAARNVVISAAEVLDLATSVAEEMAADIDGMIAKIAEDAEALYNKFMTELPGCIEQIPEDAQVMIGGAILLTQKGLEEGKKQIEAELAAKLAELEARYGKDEAEIKAELEKLAAEYGVNKETIEQELNTVKAKIEAEVNAKYAVVSAEIQAQIEAEKAEAAAKIAALEAELKGYQAELENAAEEAKAGIQAQIDRVKGDIAAVNENLACAVAHLENAAEIAYNEIVAEVTEAYEAAVAELEKALAELKAEYEKAVATLNQKLAELKAAYDKAVEELIAAADKTIKELEAEVQKQLEELGKIGDELAKMLDAILESIREELNAAQNAVSEILKGNLEAIEDLTDALVALGAEALVEAVGKVMDQIEALFVAATTANLVIDDDFKYVAIGDGSAAPESYVEKLAEALNAGAAENGVDEIDVINYAKAGNTVAAERANLSDVSDADLITIGFSNIEFLDKAVASTMTGAEMDWSAIVGEENVQYVDQLLAEVAAKIAETGMDDEYTVLVNTAIEAYAYAAVQYATELPELVNDISAINPDALIIIVGMYNPMEDVTISLGNDTYLNIGEYVDYLVEGVAAHGVAYAILTGNAIYVDAPAVETINTDNELTYLELAMMAYNRFANLYPSAAGDDYISAAITGALNITYMSSEVSVLYGDVNLDGVVDQSDVTLLFAYVLGNETLNEQQMLNADVNYDDMVDQSDLTKLFSYVLGEIPSL